MSWHSKIHFTRSHGAMACETEMVAHEESRFSETSKAPTQKQDLVSQTKNTLPKLPKWRSIELHTSNFREDTPQPNEASHHFLQPFVADHFHHFCPQWPQMVSKRMDRCWITVAISLMYTASVQDLVITNHRKTNHVGIRVTKWVSRWGKEYIVLKAGVLRIRSGPKESDLAALYIFAVGTEVALQANSKLQLLGARGGM